MKALFRKIKQYIRGFENLYVYFGTNFFFSCGQNLRLTFNLLYDFVEQVILQQNYQNMHLIQTSFISSHIFNIFYQSLDWIGNFEMPRELKYQDCRSHRNGRLCSAEIEEITNHNIYLVSFCADIFQYIFIIIFWNYKNVIFL